MPLDHFARLGLALAIGLLVGVERGWQGRDVAEGGPTAGIRTYALSGLLGGFAGLLGQALGGWAFAAICLPYASAFILFRMREAADDQDHPATAVVAGMLVFALGAYCVIGEWRLAAAAGVVTTALLAFKQVLHAWLKRLTWAELRSALILLAMSLVALPLLPDRAFGPYGAVNPHELWLLTIALASVSFLAYAAIRIFGPTGGVALAGVVGALVSSTAVTLFLARGCRQAPKAIGAYLAGALLAGAVMAARIGVLAGVLAPALLWRLAAPLAAFGAVSIVLGLFAAWKGRGDHGANSEAPMKSPFDLSLVVRFALVLGVVMAASRVLSALYGAQGLFPVAAVAGLADVDAVTLTVSQLAAKGLDLDVGAAAVLLAAGVDGISKAVIATVVGGRRFGLLFSAGSAIAAAAAGAMLYWQS